MGANNCDLPAVGATLLSSAENRGNLTETEARPNGRSEQLEVGNLWLHFASRVSHARRPRDAQKRPPGRSAQANSDPKEPDS